ncbi:MAG: lysophospholipid acyltransferase family protein [Deltaproteobacteria bacterium]|nr:lysophospholipid acyltransferase family protein [Deltaproteobacteria bacterium]
MGMRLLKVVSFLIGCLPLGFGRFFGRLAFYLDKKHRGIALKNLETAFGKEKDNNEIYQIAKKVFENLGMNLIEFCRIPRLNSGNIDKIVVVKGFDNFLNAYKKSKGVLFLTAHFGNWELMAAAHALKGYPLNVVVREPDSPVFARFINYVRSSCGNKIMDKRSQMRKLLDVLKKGECVGVLLDQNVTWSEGVFVDFFGKLAATNKGFALLAIGSQSPVIPVFMIRKDNGKHELFFGEEIPIQITEDKKLDVLANTARFTKVIEDMIRKEPSQWFWVHQRWKSRPENDPNKGKKGEAMVA